MVLKQKKLFWQIFPISLVIILSTISLVGWYGSRSVDRFYIEELGNELENRAYLVRSQVLGLLDGGDVAELRQFAVDSGRASGTRITVINPEGIVLADTNEDPDKMDNHRMRPEINTAFDGTPGIRNDKADGDQKSKRPQKQQSALLTKQAKRSADKQSP